MNRSRVPAVTRRRMALLGVAVAALLLGACGHSADVSSPSASGEPQLITVRASEFSFSETTIRVQAGRPVRLLLENSGALEHDFRVVKLPAKDVRVGGDIHGHVDEVAAHATVGKQAWVEFTATEKGTYDVECTVAGHKDAGMTAKLVVV